MLKLDLHGVRHSEVNDKVINFVLVNQYHLPLSIVCGNSQKMISLVQMSLQNINCQFIMLRYGTITVTGM